QELGERLADVVVVEDDLADGAAEAQEVAAVLLRAAGGAGARGASEQRDEVVEEARHAVLELLGGRARRGAHREPRPGPLDDLEPVFGDELVQHASTLPDAVVAGPRGREADPRV